ncbi:MAG: HAMP domain-containing sensor histidine kinase [Vicinamibacterales bacterium]
MKWFQSQPIGRQVVVVAGLAIALIVVAVAWSADRTSPERLLAIGVSAVGGVLLLVVWLSRQTTRGLDALRSAAQRISAGDFSPPPNGPAPNLEVAQLQEAFVAMAANLREARDALDRQVEEERKMREMLQSLQRQVVRQERLAAVGALVSGVAHELNNPLQAILGAAELIERRKGLAPDILADVTLLKTQSQRAREIIHSLARFGSQQSVPPALVDLQDVITEVAQLRRPNLEQSSIAFEVEWVATRKVHANVTELVQVLLNFVINAQQAIESTARTGGRILVRLFETGRKVRVEVHDNGPGIQSEYESKLFQPFFTTKPVGKGTGLGLSVSYGIIHSYGGTIGHAANPWGGATFFFELPAVEASSPVSA